MNHRQTANTVQRKQTIYLVRHAEASHNVLEKKAVEQAIADGVQDFEEREKVRRAVLNAPHLKDAPLSQEGREQARRGSFDLQILEKLGKHTKPSIILVSPLRRALMTATELFAHQQDPKPRFIALEALREKRTGFTADERSSVEELEQQFPHVDFSDLKNLTLIVNPGEDNPKVRARGKAFVEGPLSKIYTQDSVALVTHKGWLRELRKTLRSLVDQGELKVNFDLGDDKWVQTLYKNAEVRVAEFGFDENQILRSIVSKSIENAMSSAIEDAVKHLIQKSIAMHMPPALVSKLVSSAEH
mmetsp:Transcript_28679/g.69472  ORF Transcript_28679/g.69472 Transcript_28679/m.69472 type:complete len:301 (-) Transcript_28679:88-990(-)